MEFIRETIAHRSTSSNIGSDEIHAQCIDIKEEAVDLEEHFSNVKENSETKDTQELPQNLTDINPMPKSPKKACITQPRSRGSQSPIKRSRGSIDKQIDLELLKMLKEEKRAVTIVLLHSPMMNLRHMENILLQLCVEWTNFIKN